MIETAIGVILAVFISEIKPIQRIFDSIGESIVRAALGVREGTK